MGRFLEVGSRHHEFRTSHIQRSLHYQIEIGVVGLLAVIDASEDGVAEVDADLLQGSEKNVGEMNKRKS